MTDYFLGYIGSELPNLVDCTGILGCSSETWGPLHKIPTDSSVFGTLLQWTNSDACRLDFGS